jgi:hypothetical protein
MVHRGQNVHDDKDFSVMRGETFLGGSNVRQFVEDCYRENALRMRAFDSDLTQPRLLTAIADLALRGLPFRERRRLGRAR